MAQQADRMRISEKKLHNRERRPSNGSSADSGTGGFAVRNPLTILVMPTVFLCVNHSQNLCKTHKNMDKNGKLLPILLV